MEIIVLVLLLICAGNSNSEGPWSEWAPCSTTCGGGVTYRTRSCATEDCDHEWDASFCNTLKCPEIECSKDQFKCADGNECIEKSKFCDGVTDCTDESDEITFDYAKKFHNGIPCRVYPKRDTGGKICVLPKDQAKKKSNICAPDISCATDEVKCADGKTCIKNFCEFMMHLPKENYGFGIIYNETLHSRIKGVQCQTLPKSFRLSCLAPALRIGTCMTNQYRCRDGSSCIYLTSFCNGIKDCNDGSDEISFEKARHSMEGIACRSRTLRTKSCLLPYRYISQRYGVCRKDDVGSRTVTCNFYSFRCSDGIQCIQPKHFCDGIKHCRDGSDEIPYDDSGSTGKDGIPCRNKRKLNHVCMLPNREVKNEDSYCRQNADCTFFKCLDGTKCLSSSEFCDGKNDCSDGSDELLFVPGVHDGKDGLACRSTKNLTKVCLLPREFIREQTSMCRPDDSCRENEFKCADGSRCLDNKLFCNGVEDCSDGSDETLFHPSKSGVKDGRPCRNPYKSDQVCLLRNRMSTNWKDVCKQGNKCKEGEFQCTNGKQCVVGLSFCDGIKDCRDGSDEIGFDSAVHKEEDGIPCRNIDGFGDICVLPRNQASSKLSLCRIEPSCGNKEFRCSDGSGCFSSFRFCNGRRDCRDGSDEIKFDASVQKKAQGISCRNRNQLDKICLLPAEQAEKEFWICREDTSCDEDQFKCGDGTRCLMLRDFCDGVEQCSDGSDELKYDPDKDGIACRHKELLLNVCLLPRKQSSKKAQFCRADDSCPEGYFKCLDGSKCVKKEQFCSGWARCSDNSDKIFYDASKHTKEDGIPCQHKLFSYTCLLPKAWMSMKKEFCREEMCDFPDEFKCADGSCLSPAFGNKFCDGYMHCRDGSDELIYNPSIHTEKDGVRCRKPTEMNTFCLLSADQAWKKDVLCVM